jgi:hypothetical protein
MLNLYSKKGVRFFSFQDDDFASRTPSQQEWLRTFLRELARTGLASQTRWKISCRVDDLQPTTLQEMRDHGLMAVYLGVESGSEVGLRMLNKRVTVAQNLAAIDLIKRTDLALGIGFMLFDPSSTVETIRENLCFLRTVGEDGYFPVNFCKMLPYAGTPIETQLHREGRLTGTVVQPDYRFLDPALDWYEAMVKRIFTRRNFAVDGNVVLQQQADFSYRIGRTFGHTELPEGRGERLRRIIGRTNALVIETLGSLLDELVARGVDSLLEDEETLVGIAEREWRGEMEAEVELAMMSTRFSSASPSSLPIDNARLH